MLAEVSFRDLKFDHAFRLVAGRKTGSISQRWIPLGMPRINRELERCVFFLHGHEPKTGQIVGPRATGFFVGRDSSTLPGLRHIYAVSNQHAVNPWSHIAIETTTAGPELLEFDPSEWTFSGEEDLAVIDVTDQLTPLAEQDKWLHPITCVHERDFLTPDLLSRDNVGIGDDTLMLGLFVDHASPQRTAPVGRFGSLAATPHIRLKVSVGASDDRASPAFLNDMRSRTGFSGSPVWVWRTPYTDMNSFLSDGFNNQIFSPQPAFLRLIGVHRGQFQETTEITLGKLSDGQREKFDANIASSMTVVIPAWTISALLDDASLERQRRARDQRADRIELSESISKLTRFLE